MVHKRIQEWTDPNEEDDNEEFSVGQESISEDAVTEIREISKNQGHLSKDSIIRTIPDTRIEEAIRYYRSVIVQFESELARRALDNEHISDENYYENVSDVGSLRFLDNETYFTLGFSGNNTRNKNRRTSKGNRLATGRKSVALRTKQMKLENFINKLTLTEDEKVNLLEEWEKITNESS